MSSAYDDMERQLDNLSTAWWAGSSMKPSALWRGIESAQPHSGAWRAASPPRCWSNCVPAYTTCCRLAR